MPAYYVRAAIRSEHTASGALIVNTIHYEVDQLSSPGNYTGMASDLWTAWGTQYLAVLSTGDHCHELTVTQEDQDGVAPAQGVFTVAANGTRVVSDSYLSPALCQMVALKTNTPKRYGRGRTFMPPAYSRTQTTDGGTWDPATTYAIAVAAWSNVAQKPFTHGSTSYTPIIYSRTQRKAGASTYTFPIVANVPQPQQHFLRSRLSSP